MILVIIKGKNNCLHLPVIELTPHRQSHMESLILVRKYRGENIIIS